MSAALPSSSQTNGSGPQSASSNTLPTAKMAVSVSTSGATSVATNMTDTTLPSVALIAGPTASGKSALAIALAEKRRGTVINADSAQVYADLRVLTARPSDEEEARCPHRLFGHIDGGDLYSAARWAAEARAAIHESHAEGRLPILVGGTGLYLLTLLDGIAPIPDIEPEIREEIRAMPVAEAHGHLARLDPEAAARLHPSDTSRAARAPAG